MLVAFLAGTVLLSASGIQALSVSPGSSFEAGRISSTEIAEEPDLKFEHIPTIAEDFKDDSVLVVLKHQYSRVNQEINPTAFETEKMALAPVTELSQESAAIDGNATLDSAQYQIKFTDIQDLTSVPQEAEDSPLIDKTVFNQILRIKLQTKGKEKVLEAIEELKKIEGVLDAEPEYNYYAQEDMTPNDPYFSTQSWGLKKIHAESAWDITTGSSNVKVGVMEAGIASHADLNAHILSGNFTPAANADLSHGTHVAGIIGAVSNNGIGIAGTAQVALIPLDRTKFVDSLTYANSNQYEGRKK